MRVLLILASSLLSSAAVAQNQPAGSIQLPPGSVQVDGFPVPAAQPPAVLPLPNTMPAAAPAASGAGPMPAQPPGGFGVALPMPAGGDAASTMTLQGADAYLGQIKDGAMKGTDRLAQGAVPAPAAGGSAPTLPNAPITNPSDLDELSRVNRSIQILDAKVKEAEAAVKLWGIVFNNEHAKAWREKQAKEQAEAKKREEDAAKARAELEKIKQVTQSTRGAPSRAMPVVYEVMGSRATVLIPGQGEVVARAGSLLPNGMKVLSVNSSGVTVDQDGETLTLAFGSLAGSQAQAQRR